MLSRRNLLATGAASVGLAACTTNDALGPVSVEAGNVPSPRLAAFFEENFDANLAKYPERATSQGDKRGYDKWNDDTDVFSGRALIEAQQANAALKNLVRSIPGTAAQLALGPNASKAAVDRVARTLGLHPSDALSVRLFDKNTQRATASAPFRGHGYLFDQMNGAQSGIPTFLANQHKVASVEDAQAYIARLEGVTGKLGTLVARSQASAARGITPPKFIFDYVIADSANLLKGAPFTEGSADSPMWADAQAKMNGLSVEEATKTRLKNEARAALLAHVKPAYENLIAVMTTQQANARGTDGVWALPDGEAYYAERLANQTTTNLSANEIHQIGLDNVARIHGEMGAIMRQVGFTGTRDAFFDKLETDPQFFIADTPEGKAGYIARATELIDTMRAKIPTAFNLMPKAPMVVRAVEPFREKSAGLAFYQRPTPDGSRPGIYYINTSNVKAIPTYQMEALAYHEGIPGHHMQIAIAQELQGIPKFRRFGGFTAYSEGWGLYTEKLGKDMGFYTDPYSDFGRLTLELRRAIRLVVDTGLHHKRWPRQQAIDYILANQPGDVASARRDIDRYIVMPGQATAYLIGQIEILRLREAARTRLGAGFTLAKFHDVVLGNGSVPLDVLGELVGAMV
jgi:uncharacterized protein (DUF885 family)